MGLRFHGLKKVKVRQTWNKHNLYNLSRYRTGSLGVTFFQQKWKAKSISRAYHGERIRERQWHKLFRPRMKAVIPMDHRYLAEKDGSELAAGRGSGKDIPLEKQKFHGKIQFNRHQIPYMSNVYAPTERRLDIAVFRALFASSARQARQFVVHGSVKVNGKKMIYPGYLLNPGDMFQVDPDRVLFATGAPKTAEQIRKGRAFLKAARAENKTQELGRKTRAAKRAEAEKEESKPEEAKPAETVGTEEEELGKRRVRLRELRGQAQDILLDTKVIPSGKSKQMLRQLSRDCRSALSQLSKKPLSDIDEMISKFASQLQIRPEREPRIFTRTREASKAHAAGQGIFRQAVRRARENPIDENKPYATPWQPRPYMSAFAFIPRYLEVNQNICSAVYLRHPVARPGLAEVPSPFAPEVLQLAHNWYLRRR